MKIRKWEAKGVLGELLANTDEREFAKTRKRMMLAAKIEDAMKRRGLNQAQFAKLMGKSQTVISEWLSGDRNFTTDTLADIEETLGVQLLNVSVMTVIPADTTSLYSASSKKNDIAIVKPQGTWKLQQDLIKSDLKTKYA